MRFEHSLSWFSDGFRKLSEKGYDQRSDHEFGWYTEGEMDRKVAFGGPQGYAARVLETFQTVSMAKFAERAFYALG